MSLSVKDELSLALQTVLDQLHPGCLPTTSLSSPAMKSHGDLATPVALHLAKTKKASPISLANEIIAALQGMPVYTQWVSRISPGCCNNRRSVTGFPVVVLSHMVLQAFSYLQIGAFFFRWYKQQSIVSRQFSNGGLFLPIERNAQFAIRQRNGR